MTYLYITPFFPSQYNWRGAYCLDFVKALRKARPELQVEVFMVGDGGDYLIDGIKVWRFQEKKLPSSVFPFLFKRHNERSFLKAVKRAGIKVDDIIVCHANTAHLGIYPVALKRLNRKCKAILHHHDLQSFGLNLGIFHKCPIYNAWLFRKLRMIHEQIDCHVFVSEASRRSFLSAPDSSWTLYNDYKAQMRGPKAFGCRPAKITTSIVLHNGVNLRVYVPANKRNTRTYFVIGCVGNFAKLKDQMTLLKAVAMLNKAQTETPLKVIFVGSGEMLSECKSFA